MLQREITTVTDVFEKYNICKKKISILLLYMKLTFCPAGTYFLHKLNDMFIFQVECAIKTQLISE
jgi:hypothetical protein